MPRPLWVMQHLLSVEREPRLEVRLLQLFSLEALFISLLTLPFNVLEHLSIYHLLTVLMLGVTSLGFLVASLKGHHHFKLFTLGLVLVVNICWFADGGSLSSIGSFFCLGLMAMSLFFRGWLRLVSITLFLLDVGLLFFLDYLRPEWIIPFKSPFDRFLESFSGSLISLVTFTLAMFVLIASYDRERKNLAASNARLHHSLDEIRTLQGLLPICAWCKKVRDDEGLWTQLEQYFTERTDLAFTHGLCPDCAKEQTGQLKDELPTLEELRAGRGPDSFRDRPPI